MPGIDGRAARCRRGLAAVPDWPGFVPSVPSADPVRGPCPVHRSRRPASRSWAGHWGKRLWRCFVGGAGGNALDRWVAVTRPDSHAAVPDVCARLGRDVPWLSAPGRVGPDRVAASRRPRDRGAQPLPDR
jgi:hypothetical protein